jgi:hypothetical protein
MPNMPISSRHERARIGGDQVETKFLRKAQVAARYGINVRSVERWEKDGRLPAPMYRGRIPLWRESGLDAADRAAMAAPRSKATKPAAKPETATAAEVA